MALRLDKDRPAGAQPAQRVVEASGDRDELGGKSAVEVWSPEFRGPLKRAVLFQDDPFVDQGRPRQEIGEPNIRMAVFREIHHAAAHVLRWVGIRTCRRTTSTNSGSRLAAQTEAMWPTNQRRRPAIHRRRPRPRAAAIVPFRIATDRGAPPIRIGSVKAR